ncbi:MAG: winged helix-turn-helix transcriptional regulator [Pseudomonadota bacterium]
MLNECLRKNVGFGILDKVSYPEIPPRVEYEVTAFGKRFMKIIDDIEALQTELDQESRY